jgi:hypothetical protein
LGRMPAAFDISHKPGALFWRLVKRSGWAILGLLVVIFLINCDLIPTPPECSRDDLGMLKQVLVLHRHGALPLARLSMQSINRLV